MLSHEPTDPHASLDPTLPDMASMVEYPAACPTLDAASQHAVSSVTHGSVAHLGLPDLRTWEPLVHVELWHVGRAAQHAISSVTHGSVAHLGLPALRTWELLVHVELWHVGLLVALHTIVYDTAAVPVMRYSPSSSVCVVQ